MGDETGENSIDFGAPNADGDGDDGGSRAKRSIATVLVDVAEERYEFGVSTTGETYAVPRTGPRVVYLLRGGKRSLRAELAREYRRRTGKVAPGQALADAMLTIEGIAQDAESVVLHLRVARVAGAVWLDLGDDTGRAVRITDDGWQVTDAVPVLFARTVLTGALPEPVRGGDLGELWSWLNVAPRDRPLILAALIAQLDPDVPHVVIGVNGENGSGKSTATRVLVSLLDPSPVTLRKAPKDAEAWVTAAAGSLVVGIENLSSIPDWLSDSICRASTGEGDVRRKLYTDGQLSVFAFRRCVIANGIDFGALRGDLAERMLSILLFPIGDDDRAEEKLFWPLWHTAHPRILGAVLELAAACQRASGAVQLTKKPRMADYARTLATVDQVLGTTGLARYLSMQADMATDSLTGDPFVIAVAQHIGVTTFDGTSAQLLDLVERPDRRPPKGWPAGPRQVTTLLKRQAPVMRKAGWTITDDDGRNEAGIVR